MCRPKSVDIVYCTDRWDIQTEVEEMGEISLGNFVKVERLLLLLLL
jgi:hypothetical protein